MSSKHSKSYSSSSSSSSSKSAALHRTQSHHRSKKPSSSSSSSSSSSASASRSPPKQSYPYPSSSNPSAHPDDGEPFPPFSSPALESLRPKRSAPIDIPKRPPRPAPPISLSYSESLAAAKAELDPKNRPPGTVNPLITMPEGSFIPPHILAERARGPPKMARSFPGKQRFKDNGNPPDWWY